MIVVLSDGENNQRPDPAAAAQAAADRGVRIMAIGVGTAAGATLDLDGFKVQTALDEGTLQQIADTTAGAYHPAADGDPAAAVYGELARRLVVRSEPMEVTALRGRRGPRPAGRGRRAVTGPHGAPAMTRRAPVRPRRGGVP